MGIRYRASRLVKGTLFRPRARREGLAINGGTPVRDPRIPWPPWPSVDLSDRVELLRTFESGKWWFGPKVKDFEARFAERQGARHCITCSTGTIGLELVMQAHGIQPGDEVLVPAFTFVATATAVARMGGVPVFVDVDDSWCMDPKALEPALTPRTRAILPVHFAGRIADMDAIGRVAEQHGLTVYEDAAHAWGAAWKGKGAGALGRAGVFSFQMSKNLTAAEGGAIVTDDDAFADECRSLVNCGRGKDQPWYHHVRMGTNARITELQASLLLTQLEKLEEQMRRRERNAAILDRGLAGIDGLSLQPGDPRITRHAYHYYLFRIDPERFGCDRMQFIKACQAEGLPLSETFYPEPLYRQPVFRDHPSGRYRDVRCPVSEDLAHRSAVWLNHWLLLGQPADMHQIVEIVHKVKDRAAEIPRV